MGSDLRGSRVLAVLARLVPRGEREEWLREWEAELATLQPRERSLTRCLAAAAEDALRLRLRRSRPPTPDALLRDARLAVRGLLHAPLFTAAVVLTLALGIGANTAMFTVVDAALLEPLPYPEGERLVRVRTVSLPAEDVNGFVSTGDYDDLVERTRALEDPSFRRAGRVTYQAERPFRLEAAGVSSGYFRLFGTTPHLGRYLRPEEDARGHAPAAVLSYGLWQRVFGRDPDIVDRTVTLDGQPYQVVGVAESGFRDPIDDVDVWTSRPAYIDLSERDQPWLQVFARLAPGVTLADARAELARISGDLAREHPDTNRGHVLEAELVAETRAAPVRPALLVLSAFFGLVLLITCANVANLVLVRSAGRSRELAVRVSLGAGRGRLAGQLLVEGLVLALVGGAAGLALAALATRAFAALGAPGMPRLAEARIDGTAVLFTLLLTGATGVLFGLTPLATVAAGDPARTLRESGRGGEGRRARRLRRGLVAGELAVSAVLLVGAVLLVRSLVRLANVDTGVRAQDVLVFHVAPPREAYPTAADLRAYYGGLRADLARLPDVEAVGGVNMLPFTGDHMYEFTRDDRPAPPPGEERLVDVRIVEPGYFETVGIPLVRGRLLEDRDGGDAPPVLLVDEEMERRFFPGEDPIGTGVSIPWGAGGEPVSYEVVGVVGAIRHRGPASQPRPTLYLLRGHDSTPYWENFGLWVTVRASGDPTTLAPAVRETVWAVDGRVPLTEMGPLEALLDRHRSGSRQRAILIGAFALLAVLLAGVGIAGVVAYAVSARALELGVRQALGADRGDVVRLVLREGLVLAGIGVPAGLLLAAGGSRLLRSFLFGVEPGDPATYAGVGAGLLSLALAAAWLPARRAAEVPPSDAMRAE